VNHQIYEAFRFHYYNLSSVVDTRKNIDREHAKSNFEWISGAFCLGWKFAETALLELPNHGYFYSNEDPKLVQLRRRSSRMALEVTRLLQRILKLLDSIEIDGRVPAVLLDVSGATNDSSRCDPNALWLVKANREECKRKLATLKDLAKEQCERLGGYEAKRSRVASSWYNHPSTSATSVGVGNHRGRSGHRTSSFKDAPGTAPLVDCETICSRLFCPTALPESPPAPQQELTVLPRTTLLMPQSSLADEASRDTDDESDPALSAAPTPEKLPNPPSGNLQTKNSTDSVRTPSSSRRNVSEKSIATQSRTSTRSIPTKKDDSKKSGVQSYTNRLFGKKTAVWQQHQEHRTREASDLEEALYQSELEAAKAVSIRESCSSMDERESLSSASSWMGESRGGTSDAHDYDLQHALYLSGLEVQAQPQRRPTCSPRRSRSDLEFDDGEEKRDDSVREEGRSPSRRQEAVAKAVSEAVAKARVSAPVIVKGVPVVMAPPGAVHRRDSTDPYSKLKVLKSCCQNDFERLREHRKIVVTRVPTYQGRVKGSTNGCTVIAPLLCVHHFKTKANNRQTSNDSPSRLPDATISSIIDTECPSILPAIRTCLGVSKNAFLIPHDAHESLINSEHMCRDQFVNVCGGNILEDDHLDSLIKELCKVLPDGKKLGATFFFHQHVIAILQLRQCGSKKPAKKKDPTPAVSFDVIDSLPNKATLPSDDNEYRHRPPDCARIFCKDADSLKATLKWYACSVFTPENESYIDAYQWDEKLTDFDPRVFQAFLWKEA
jgi:hypothetical protein